MIVYINYTNNANNYAIFKNRLERTFLIPNTSTSPHTTLAADAHLAEGQSLDEEQTLNSAKSLIYRAEFLAEVNLNKNESIKTMSPSA
jgi:hypothetical protein